MDQIDIKISKFLSYVLRHQPESIGLALDNERWADNGVWLTKTVPVGYMCVI
ncbi:RNA 2'-phosphotransferase [Xenorhabdus vietnamensis]|uniref:RNA 2'-phosphotransferase n=1 Tax=Xenorhabdus vietnamensis TaxID=351656 RepID=A0A1Y2SJ76_9GAMM|nr:RNA 2'-phosphotransferase [Xenorhabdus vietnamensis]